MVFSFHINFDVKLKLRWWEVLLNIIVFMNSSINLQVSHVSSQLSLKIAPAEKIFITYSDGWLIAVNFSQ